MTNIINTTSNFQGPNININKENIQETLATSKQVVSDNFESTTAGKTVTNSINDQDVMRKSITLLPALMLADDAVEKLIAGKDNKGILAKIANFGDKVSDKFHLERFFSTEKKSRFSQFIKENRFTKYFTNEYKAIPKCSMAKTNTIAQELSDKVPGALTTRLTDLKYNLGFSEELSKKAITLSDDAIKALGSIGSLKVGVTPEYLTGVKATIGELSTKITNPDQLKILSALDQEIDDFFALIIKSKNPRNISTKNISESISNVLKYIKNNNSTLTLSGDAKKIFKSIASNSDDAIAALPKDKIFSITDELIEKGLDGGKEFYSRNRGKLTTLRNKVNAAELKTGKTLFGKMLAKGTVKGKNIATYGGGAISLFFAANAIVQSTKAAKEAPEGEKLSTFMHVLSEQYLGFILFQPSINLLYKAGGNKYRGMTTEGRAALTELVKNANKNVDGIKIVKMQKKLLEKGADINIVKSMTGKSLSEAKQIAQSLNGGGILAKVLGLLTSPVKTIKSIFAQKPAMTQATKDAIKEITEQAAKNQPILKEATKVANIQKDLLIRGVDKDKVAQLTGKGIKEAKKLAKGLKKEGAKIKFWEKPLKFFGKILDTGLDTIKSPTTSGKIGKKLKGFAGGFGRFALILFVIQPFIQKPITKLINKIFGKPTTYLEKQKAATEAQENTNAQLSSVIDEKSTTTNLLDKWTNIQNQAAQQPNNPTNQQPNNQTAQPTNIQPAQTLNPNNQTNASAQEEIPALNIFNKDKKSERYIPSIQVEHQDNSTELEKQADKIIKSTDGVLKSSRNLLQ